MMALPELYREISNADDEKKDSDTQDNEYDFLSVQIRFYSSGSLHGSLGLGSCSVTLGFRRAK